MENKPVSRITLALILAACCMAAISSENMNVPPKDTDVKAPAILADAIVNSYLTPETPSKETDTPLQGEAVPVVPFEDIISPESIEEGTDTLDEEEVSTGSEVEERTWFDKVYDYLLADDNSVKAKAFLMKKKFDVKQKYGEDAASEPTFSTILQIERDSSAADEVRAQKQLALEVAQESRDKLYNESLECLALNGYHEARAETADQEVATAAVVFNRLSVNFRGATTVCEVIYTPKQFSWVEQHGRHTPDTSNKLERQAWERSLLIARRMLDPDATFIDPSNGALYYYNPSLVDWKYKHAYRQVAVLGNHRFMTEKLDDHPHHINNRQVRINPVLFNGMSKKERLQLIDTYQNEGDK